MARIALPGAWYKALTRQRGPLRTYQWLWLLLCTAGALLAAAPRILSRPLIFTSASAVAVAPERSYARLANPGDADFAAVRQIALGLLQTKAAGDRPVYPSFGTPTLNVLCLRTSGPGRGLHEMPYLYGSFGCEYRYGHLSLPFLRGGSGKLALDALQSWGALGYPTYSGSATYRCRVSLQEGGDYVLDLGRVEDCAAVSLDGEQVAVLPWPPYRCALSAMAPGGHELAVEVCNPPANRNRAAGLVAGLLGPVRVGR